VKKDVTELREQYHKEKLTKDVLSQEKHVLCKLIWFWKEKQNWIFVIFLADALSRSESYRAEVEVELSKERSESAALRDLLCKVQALNEGLAHDKIELNKIILLVCVFLLNWDKTIILYLGWTRKKFNS
jgi:hypothetical protein